MDLILPDIRTVPPIITCTVEGILEADDLHALFGTGSSGGAQVGEVGQPRAIEDPANLKKIREKHHGVARLMAQGLRQSLVASITGYTENYLSVLLNNPAMQELIEMYRLQYGNTAMVIGEKLRTVGLKALEALDEKLDNDQITDTHELAAVAKLGLDRAGHGPTSTSKVETETHVYDHAALKALNDAARKGSSDYIVPSHVVRNALPAPKDDVDADR
jgi:hypothetical protein